MPDGFILGSIRKKIVCNNGFKEIRVNTLNDVPNGYVLGTVRKQKNMKCYTNGKDIRFYGEGDTIPEGYTHSVVSRSTRGGTYYNDGVHNKLIKEGETPPKNYVLGKTNIGGTSNTKCYTNGVRNKYIKIGSEIPDGFTLGRAKKK